MAGRVAAFVPAARAAACDRRGRRFSVEDWLRQPLRRCCPALSGIWPDLGQAIRWPDNPDNRQALSAMAFLLPWGRAYPSRKTATAGRTARDGGRRGGARP